MNTIERLPKGAWTAGIDQNGDTVHDTFLANPTSLLDLGSWRNKIPGLRIIMRNKPLHPHYRKRPTEQEKQLGHRYQPIATNTKVGQIAWLDARHRSNVHVHVHVENDINQATTLGLPALGDQRRVDPDQHAGREPARPLPPPGPPRE
jgi:hypothetical protein